MSVSATSRQGVHVGYDHVRKRFLPHRRRPALRTVQHVGFGVPLRRAARHAWAVGFHDSRVSRRALELARRLGLETTVYTVNDPARMRELAALGVGGIFTDRPDLLRRTLAAPDADEEVE